MTSVTMSFSSSRAIFVRSFHSFLSQLVRISMNCLWNYQCKWRRNIDHNDFSDNQLLISVAIFSVVFDLTELTPFEVHCDVDETSIVLLMFLWNNYCCFSVVYAGIGKQTQVDPGRDARNRRRAKTDLEG